MMHNLGEKFDVAYDRAVEAVGRISTDRLERVLQVWSQRDDRNDLVWAMKRVLSQHITKTQFTTRYA